MDKLKELLSKKNMLNLKKQIEAQNIIKKMKDADRIKNESITEKATEIENTITSLTTELNKTLANLGNNVNEKTATNVKTATSKVATETKSELEIYREELSKFEKELEELQFKRVRMPHAKRNTGFR